MNERSSEPSCDLLILEEDEVDLQPNENKELIENPKYVDNSENEVSCIDEQLENQCDTNSQLSFASIDSFNDERECHLRNDHSEITHLNTSSIDEGLSHDNKYTNKNLEPSCCSMVDESFEPPLTSFENTVDDDLVDELRIIIFHDPCKGDFWLEFGEPCYDTSSIESEAMLDDDQFDDDSISTSSIPSLHPSENAINEAYPFPSVEVNLFEEDMLEDNFSSSNDQSFETAIENVPSQKLLSTEYIWDDNNCDSTHMILIDPYQVFFKKTFGESHQVNNIPFGVLCEGSAQPLKLDKS